MIRAALAIALADLRRTTRRRDAILWLLVMPLPFIYFFGVAFRDRPRPPTPVVVAAPAADPVASRLAATLREHGYDASLAPPGEQAPPEDGFRVELPAGLASRMLAGTAGEIVIRADAEGPETSAVKVLVWRTLLRIRLEALARLARGEEVAPAVLAEPLPLPVRLETRPWGPRREVPSGMRQTVPGNLVMFPLLAVLVTGAVRLLADRELGLLRRTLSLPVPAGAVVAGQLLSLAALGTVEMLYLLALGRLVFGVRLGPAPWAVVGLLLLLVSAASGIAVLLASTLRTVQQGVAVGLLLTLGLGALGGCWWPLEVVPRWMRTLAMTLPTGQAMRGVVRLVVWHDPPTAVAGHALYLAVLAAVAVAAGAATLRRRLG